MLCPSAGTSNPKTNAIAKGELFLSVFRLFFFYFYVRISRLDVGRIYAIIVIHFMDCVYEGINVKKKKEKKNITLLSLVGMSYRNDIFAASTVYNIIRRTLLLCRPRSIIDCRRKR